MANTLSFLTKPIKLVQSLWDQPTPPEVAGAAQETANALHGVCGWVNNDAAAAGSADWICQAFGQKMPGVVFFVSISVMLGTAAFLARYVSRTMKAIEELESLKDQLEQAKLPTPAPFAGEDAVKKMTAMFSESGRNIPPLSDYSSQIRSSTIDVKSDGRFALQTPLSKLSSGLPHLERWTGKTLADTLPNWLTAIGLLTTFMAILLGLQNVKVMANLEVRGIGSLVNGLSGKFFSSIVALASAITVSIINFFLTQRISLLWESLTSKMEAAIPTLNPETLLLELVRRNKD